MGEHLLGPPRGRVIPETTMGQASLQPFPEVTEPMTILVVDDDSSIQMVLYRALEEGGYSVLAAGNGMDALEICRQSRHPIDLLVTDVDMPDMSGFDLAAHASQLQPLMKVIFMSGDADNGGPRLEDFQDLREFLPKPFGRALLMHRVKVALGC